MCRALEVNESGYYRHLGRPKEDKRQLLWGEIKEILKLAPENDNYGFKRMHMALTQAGTKTSPSSVYRVMKEHNLIHRKPKKPHNLTKSNPNAEKSEDLLNRNFKSDAPKMKTVTDITEIQCCDGKLYLSGVLDCFGGEILGICMENHMRAEMCVEAVKNAKLPAGAIVHSDHGSQFTSELFRENLRKNGILQSMGRVGSCYDNARIESFWATLKKELVYRMKTQFFPMTQVKSAVFRYIFGYYNTRRVYTANPLGLPPAVFAAQAKLFAA